MITQEKINIYKKYKGSVDSWNRAVNAKDINTLSDPDWILIGELIEDMSLIESELVSSKMKEEIENRLLANTSDEEVRFFIRNAAIKENSRNVKIEPKKTIIDKFIDWLTT